MSATAAAQSAATTGVPRGIYRINLYRELCKACGLCVAWCPQHVLASDSAGYPVAAAIDACVNCKACCASIASGNGSPPWQRLGGRWRPGSEGAPGLGVACGRRWGSEHRAGGDAPPAGRGPVERKLVMSCPFEDTIRMLMLGSNDGLDMWQSCDRLICFRKR